MEFKKTNEWQLTTNHFLSFFRLKQFWKYKNSRNVNKYWYVYWTTTAKRKEKLQTKFISHEKVHLFNLWHGLIISRLWQAISLAFSLFLSSSLVNFIQQRSYTLIACAYTLQRIYRICDFKFYLQNMSCCPFLTEKQTISRWCFFFSFHRLIIKRIRGSHVHPQPLYTLLSIDQ